MGKLIFGSAAVKLITFAFDGLGLFENHSLSLDLYASDRVVDEVSYAARRMEGIGNSISSQTVVAVTGLNATGKTTILRVTALAGDIVRGNDIALNNPLYMPLIPLISDRGVDFRAIFEDNGKWWLLESHFDVRHRDAGMDDAVNEYGTVSVEFSKEELWLHRRRHISKKELADFELFKRQSDVYATRNIGGEKELHDDVKRFLSRDRSLTFGFEFNSLPILAYLDMLRDRYVISDTAPSIVGMFDPSVERLDVDDDGRAHLKFVGENEEHVMPQVQATLMLSVGTTRGTRIVRTALDALTSGGIMIVDEIENSLNKKLIEAIIDLFKAPRTNPRSSVLVFSTHYPELLDNLERIDGIYFTTRRMPGGGVKVTKYSDIESRPDLSRADVFLSNKCRGTAPSGRAIESMFRYVANRVTGKVDEGTNE